MGPALYVHLVVHLLTEKLTHTPTHSDTKRESSYQDFEIEKFTACTLPPGAGVVIESLFFLFSFYFM